MLPNLLLLSLSFLFSVPERPYAGQQERAIKSLSEEEVEAYRQGSGVGFAKAAELNHYPGPKHVLELSAELGLDADQEARTKKVYDAMHAEAVRLGRAVLDKEKSLDDLFAKASVTPASLGQSVEEIARLQGALRAAHLAAHLEMKQVLKPEQIAKYDALRGYGSGNTAAQNNHSPHAH